MVWCPWHGFRWLACVCGYSGLILAVALVECVWLVVKSLPYVSACMQLANVEAWAAATRSIQDIGGLRDEVETFKQVVERAVKAELGHFLESDHQVKLTCSQTHVSAVLHGV